jgi:hypothetical protein
MTTCPAGINCILPTMYGRNVRRSSNMILVPQEFCDSGVQELGDAEVQQLGDAEVQELGKLVALSDNRVLDEHLAHPDNKVLDELVALSDNGVPVELSASRVLDELAARLRGSE